MVDIHSFALPGFVSQATFALTLALLAWSDARTRGTRWLAAACALQLLTMISRAIMPVPLRVSENLSACLLVLVFFLIYMGMRWFVLRTRLTTMNGPLALSAAMTTILSVGVMHPGAELAAARVAALIVLGHDDRDAAAAAHQVPGGHGAGDGVADGFCRSDGRVPAGAEPGSVPARSAARAAPRTICTMIGLTMLGFAFVGMYVAETKRRLHEETRLDSLTGLHNRRAFEEMIQREVQLAARDNTPLTLLMMDLDHFKQLNDTWGHALGDRALRTFGGVLLTVTGNPRRGGAPGRRRVCDSASRPLGTQCPVAGGTPAGDGGGPAAERGRGAGAIHRQHRTELVAARRGRLRADAASR